jgi:hypothetical protein
MMRSSTRRGIGLAVSVVLLSVCAPLIARAQASDSSFSLVGATRIGLNAGAWLSPGPVHSFSASADFAPFITEHWQLGFAPAFSVANGPGGSSVGVGLTGTANYMLGAGRTRWFVGATAGGSSGGGGSTQLDAHAGALWFFVPTTALRAQLQSHRFGFDGFTRHGASLALERYLPAGPRVPTSAPDRGAVDVSFDANLAFNGGRERTISFTLAPFLTRWSQVGGRYSAISVPFDGDWSTSQTFDGFGRLYAPLGPRAMPFLEGFVERVHFSEQTLQPPTVFGATAGVRHYLNDGVALDAGLQWRRTAAQRFEQFTAPARDYLTLQASLVTELRLR